MHVNNMTLHFLVVLIRSKNFLVKIIGSSKYRIILSENKNNLTYCFPICLPFISFFSLIALVKI